jgi:hypothetical protein
MKNTNKQGFTGFDDLSAIDPAVESLLNQGQRRNVESHLPKNLRSQRKNGSARNATERVNLTCRPTLKRLELSQKKVCRYQLVAFLLYGPVPSLRHA